MKSDMKTTHEFIIAGLPFKLKSHHDPATVRELVQLVDQKITQALELTKSGSVQSAAVLAALNLAEEVVLLKKRARKELDRLEDKVLRISQDLEASKVDKGEQIAEA